MEEVGERTEDEGWGVGGARKWRNGERQTQRLGGEGEGRKDEMEGHRRRKE